ncbi:MAG: nuclease-related domain-containing protein [Kiritimatiellae bacterium]|nr:nuclease-related domain-containing protein [Kiritimatiellia bacterium]
MPTFIGQPADFQQERAIKRRLNAVMAMFVVVMLVMFAMGWLSGYVAGRRNLWSCLGAALAFAAVIPCFKFLERRFDKHIRLARMEQDGADGEREIIPYLKKLPDTYTVVCDLDFADSYGNIDHLVIGPTGIFAIDVKNWKGTVAADGKGELLINGRPTDKPVVRAFTRRTMDLKDRIKALTRLDPYVQCLFVFPRTYIDAKWGTTGAVHCVQMDQLADYIQKHKCKNPLQPADLARLVEAAKALQALAGSPKSSTAPESQPPETTAQPEAHA